MATVYGRVHGLRPARTIRHMNAGKTANESASVMQEGEDSGSACAPGNGGEQWSGVGGEDRSGKTLRLGGGAVVCDNPLYISTEQRKKIASVPNVTFRWPTKIEGSKPGNSNT